MSTRELINELQRQKELLGNGFFDQELLEKYLDASYTKKQEIKLYGLTSVETLQNKLTRIYPYATAKPNFNRIKGNWGALYNAINNSKISVSIINRKQKQKTFKQDKAA